MPCSAASPSAVPVPLDWASEKGRTSRARRIGRAFWRYEHVRPPAATHLLQGWSPSHRVLRARQGSHALEMRLVTGGAEVEGTAVEVEGEQLGEGSANML